MIAAGPGVLSLDSLLFGRKHEMRREGSRTASLQQPQG
jgi:hypothetical protein